MSLPFSQQEICRELRREIENTLTNINQTKREIEDNRGKFESEQTQRIRAKIEEGQLRVLPSRSQAEITRDMEKLIRELDNDMIKLGRERDKLSTLEQQASNLGCL